MCNCMLIIACPHNIIIMIKAAKEVNSQTSFGFLHTIFVCFVFVFLKENVGGALMSNELDCCP